MLQNDDPLSGRFSLSHISQEKKVIKFLLQGRVRLRTDNTSRQNELDRTINLEDTTRQKRDFHDLKNN